MLAASPTAAATYSAKLIAPSTQRIIARDITWNCGPAACQGATEESRPVVLCQSLAKRAGRVESFIVDGRAFGSADLDRCNAVARNGAGAGARQRPTSFPPGPRTLPLHCARPPSHLHTRRRSPHLATVLRQYELVEKVRAYDPDADEGLINRAYVFSMKAHGAQKRASGDPYFSHPIEVAGILTDLKLDDETIVTAILHDTIEDTVATPEEIEKLFGKTSRGWSTASPSLEDRGAVGE